MARPRYYVLLAVSLIASLSLAGCVQLMVTIDMQPPAFTDIAGHPAEGALTLLTALGILDEDDGVGGQAKPDATITRAEFLELLVTAWGKADMARALTGLRPNFADEVPAEYWGYVNVADYLGVLRGYEDASFRAADAVTYAEAVTMLVRVVGGHAAQVATIAPWPYDYIFYSVDQGFSGDVDVSFPALACTFGDAARLTVAAMQVARLNPDGSVVLDSAVLTDRVGENPGDGYSHFGNLYRGVILLEEGGTIPLALAATGESDDENPVWFQVYYPAVGEGFSVVVTDPVYMVGAVENSDSLQGLEAVVVTNADGEVVFIEKLADVDVVAGVYEETTDSDVAGEDRIILADGIEIPVREWDHELGRAGGAYASVNKQAMEYYELDGFLDDWVGHGYLPLEVIVLLDAGGYAVNIIGTLWSEPMWVYEFAPSEVAEDGSESYPQVSPYGDTFVPFSIDEDCVVSLDGTVIDRDELAEFDVISVAYTDLYSDEDDPPLPPFPLALDQSDAFIIRVHREAIEGTVTATAAHYPGQLHEATVALLEGGEATYGVNETGGVNASEFGLPFAGLAVHYGLDFDGNIFVPIGYETLTPYAYCSGYEVAEGAGGPTYAAVFDLAGTASAYTLNGPIPDPGLDGPDWVGNYVKLSLTSGVVDVAATTMVTLDFTASYTVLSVDSANGALTLEASGGAVQFVDAASSPGFVIYEADYAPGALSPSSVSYSGLEGLEPGDVLYTTTIWGADWVFQLGAPE